jgi:acyl dehydratase
VAGSRAMATLVTGGPWFDDLERGQVFTAPAVTLTEGRAAVHQAILGDRNLLTLDVGLGRRVLGTDGDPAPTAFVLDTALGQSTAPTQRVKANLFYRGLQFRRMPVIGDTLRTTTEVVGLRENRRREGRAPTGLAALRVRTTDQEDREVLDFVRCAMLPLSASDAPATGHEDDLDAVGFPIDLDELARLAGGWDLAALREAAEGPYAADLQAGDEIVVGDGDPVTSAPELVRLTLNLAAVHHDLRSTGEGRRLVYGGHTFGLAAHQANRALPALAVIGAWHSGDHLAPVFEGDTLTSRLDVEAVAPLPGGAAIVHLRSHVRAEREQPVDVLDWRFAAVVA